MCMLYGTVVSGLRLVNLQIRAVIDLALTQNQTELSCDVGPLSRVVSLPAQVNVEPICSVAGVLQAECHAGDAVGIDTTTDVGSEDVGSRIVDLESVFVPVSVEVAEDGMSFPILKIDLRRGCTCGVVGIYVLSAAVGVVLSGLDGGDRSRLLYRRSTLGFASTSR